MRKAVIEIGKYVVKEGPTGGWRVFVKDAEMLSLHETRDQAIARAYMYQRGDERRARSA